MVDLYGLTVQHQRRRIHLLDYRWAIETLPGQQRLALVDRQVDAPAG
jgi:hypothetical protein